MKKTELNGVWKIKGGKYETEDIVPCSVYSALLKNGLIEDPFFRDNELKTLPITDDEFVFSRSFKYNKTENKVDLVCNGIDTLADIYVNDQFVFHADNMHRTYRIDVSKFIKVGENTIRVVFPPYDAFIKQKHAEKPLHAMKFCLLGNTHVRKAHYMNGWDWGPMLPDAGIWRDIYLLEKDSAEIIEVKVEQKHENEKVFVKPIVITDAKTEPVIDFVSPDGNKIQLKNNEFTLIPNAKLWWPNGLGEANLYDLSVKIVENGIVKDEQRKKIGLRTLKLIREKDEYGVGFCNEINGIKVFAMGADYIPEDNLITRVTKDKTRELLISCKEANFNILRVWGGGIYPSDDFFDLCDELGLMVFIDMMFACSEYNYGDEFSKSVLAEIKDNMLRLRHHASIALISGNNEIEEGGGNVVFTEDAKKGYLGLFERDLPNLLNELCPEIPYVPSSPSSFGGFEIPSDENYGDSHYWQVWHGDKPFTEFRNHYFRYLSEFGFQSFPNEKTINAFTYPEERNCFSRIMEMHQRNDSANGKLLGYLSQTFLYPAQFSDLIYAFQLLQAEAMRYAVEHLRANRGRCMGTLYWQLNDCWPVISWSSIDYYGRYKVLQYYAKRFFAPVSVFCEEEGEFDQGRDFVTSERVYKYTPKAKFTLCNETFYDVKGVVKYTLATVDGKVLKTGEFECVGKSFSATKLPELIFEDIDVNTTYLWFEFVSENKTVNCGSVLFTKPKYVLFNDPKLQCFIEGDYVKITAEKYAKNVWVDSLTDDFVLEDNGFDMLPGEKKIKIVKGTPKNITVRSVYNIR